MSRFLEWVIFVQSQAALSVLTVYDEWEIEHFLCVYQNRAALNG